MQQSRAGAIGAAIGLNLAPVGVQGIEGSDAHMLVAMLTLLSVAVFSTYGTVATRRVSILMGIAVGYVAVLVMGNGLGLLPAIDFSALSATPWLGVPAFQFPTFETSAMLLVAPVALILVAENLGHIKAIGGMIGQNMDRFIGRGFIGDDIATMVSGAGAGGGTTYVENMGVMAVTRVSSILVFVIA